MSGGAAAVHRRDFRRDDGGGGGGGGDADRFRRRWAADVGGLGEDRGRSGRRREGERFERGVQTVRTGGKRVHYTEELEENAQQIGGTKERGAVWRYDFSL